MFALLSLAALVPAADPFSLKDGDRVVWIGGTLVEREQRYGYWETALHAAFPKANFTVRNLGWSGDTVWGDSRAGFDTPKEGFKRLVGLTLELKPTVILVSYGANESFAGEAGLPKFEKGLENLLDALAPAKARVVLIGPLPYFTSDASKNAEARDLDLQHYVGVLRKVAAKRSIRFSDMRVQAMLVVTTSGIRRTSNPPLSENGIHLTEDGYRTLTDAFLLCLGASPDERVDLNKLQVLPAAIQKKNELFFHRWRPQNETYLFGFRKHEQGKNAKEVAEFDPLVDTAEKEIARIKAELLK